MIPAWHAMRYDRSLIVLPDCLKGRGVCGTHLNCLWGGALKRSPGIIRKSRILYPGPGYLSSASWPLLPKPNFPVLII